MKEHLFTSELWLPPSPAEIFPFFADAKNLGTVTPPWLHFEILTPGHIEMRVGTLIDYRIRIHGIPVRWQNKDNRLGTSIPVCRRTDQGSLSAVDSRTPFRKER